MLAETGLTTLPIPSRPARFPCEIPMRYCPRCGTTSESATCPTDGTPTVRKVTTERRGLLSGDVLGGRYRILGELGRGGFGIVFDAVHVTTGHPVAVKVLTPTPGEEGQELARRFFQEASATSRLSHPNTVRVFDFGQTDGGDLFLAMERLNGETLQSLLMRNERDGVFLTEAQAVDIGVAVLRSLGEAHAHGLVHRDMKPANIFLHAISGGDSIVKVLDFGIVKDTDSGMTQAGKALGTPTHMSPEQAMGKTVDARADLYALGVVLFECLSNSLPFFGDNPLAIVMKHVTEPVPSLALRAPGRVRPVLAGVIEKSLAKDPGDRWQSALDMRNALQAALGQGLETGMYRMPPIMPAQTPPPAEEVQATPVVAPTPVTPVENHGDTIYITRPSMLVEPPDLEPWPDESVSVADDPSPDRHQTYDDEEDFGSIVEIGGEDDAEPQVAFRSPQSGAPQPRVTLEPAPPLQVRAGRVAPEPPKTPERARVETGWIDRPRVPEQPQAGWDAWQSRLGMTGMRGNPAFDMLPLAGHLGDPRADRILQSLMARGMPDPQPRKSQGTGLSAVALSEDGRRAVLCGHDGTVRVAMLGTLGDDPVQSADFPGQIEVGEHSSLVVAVVASPDGRLVATGTVDGVVRLWDPSLGQCLGEITLDSGVATLGMATDGKLLVAGCQDGGAHLLEVPDLTLRRTLRGHRDAVTTVAVAGSRRLVVTGGEDGVVRTWDPVGGGARLTWRGHEGAVGAVAVSHNGQAVISGGWDGKLMCWYTRTGELAREIQAHRDVVAGVAVDRGGQVVASASDDRSVRVWRIHTGEMIAERTDFSAGAKCVGFLEDENAVVCCSWDGTFRLLRW
jgi:serine/threonine protein kinase